MEETGYDCIIVVDNAPKVGADRMGKLKSVLKKVFGRFGEIVSQEYPVDEEGVFKGYDWADVWICLTVYLSILSLSSSLSLSPPPFLSLSTRCVTYVH